MQKFYVLAILKRRRWLTVLITVGIVAVSLLLLWQHHHTEVDKAAELIRAGKAAAAIPILEQLSRKYPDDSTVYPWLAQGYLNTDRVAEGRTALDTAIKLKQSCSDVLPVAFAYASYYQDRNDFEEARKLFDSATSICADNLLTKAQSELYARWAKHSFVAGKLEKAVTSLDKATQYATKTKEPEQSRLLHEIAQLYRDMSSAAQANSGGDQQALKFLSLSLAASDEPITRKAMADIYMRQGNINAAIESYAAISQADENNLESRHKLIDLLLQKGDYPAAREALLELTDREKSVENYQLLSNLNLKMDNFAGAAHALQDALSLKANDLYLLSQLNDVLKAWVAKLRAEGKTEEAVSVEVQLERTTELVSDLTAKEAQENLSQNEEARWNPGNSPVTLISSHVWLAPGSFTPEGQIRIKNICGRPIKDLSLTMVFYDHTARSQVARVAVPVAAPTSTPLPAGESRLLYFSCPNTVKEDHQLAVKLFWQNRFLNEFPVVKADDLP